jgi:hypothetical protein
MCSDVCFHESFYAKAFLKLLKLFDLLTSGWVRIFIVHTQLRVTIYDVEIVFFP